MAIDYDDPIITNKNILFNFHKGYNSSHYTRALE